MKLKLFFGCKADKFVIPSPLNDNERSIAKAGVKSQWPSTRPLTTFRDLGGKEKEETFLDSQPWLESDCDDFFSVNGDFTPSRGNTPVHQSISMGNSRASEGLFEDRAPKATPSTLSANKKNLAECLHNNSQDNEDADQIISGNQYTGPNSISHSEKRPNGDEKPAKKRSVRSVQCCLPSLSSSCTYNESKKKTSSTQSRGG